MEGALVSAANREKFAPGNLSSYSLRKLVGNRDERDATEITWIRKRVTLIRRACN